MGKILIIGANGAVGKSCVQKLKDKNELVLISRSKEGDIENSTNISSFTLDIDDYENTQKFINSIDYEISGIIFALGSIVLKPFKQTSTKEFIDVMKFDILEYDKLGDIVLNLIFGAKSAAKAILNPFRALFAEDIAEWFLKPLDAAIEEKKTTEELSENFSILLCKKLATLKKLLFMTSSNSLTEVCLKGFKTIEPRAKIMPDIS